jgi:signal transduction histidine kinase
VVSISDDGIGIAEKSAERIFEMFFRMDTSGDYPGTGIGLAVCRRIVDRHGGRIWVEASPPGGSRFRFTLPRGHA